jgi:hypothetical protein
MIVNKGMHKEILFGSLLGKGRLEMAPRAKNARFIICNQKRAISNESISSKGFALQGNNLDGYDSRYFNLINNSNYR